MERKNEAKQTDPIVAASNLPTDPAALAYETPEQYADRVQRWARMMVSARCIEIEMLYNAEVK